MTFIQSKDLFIQSPTKGNGKSSFAIIERINGKSKLIKSSDLDFINRRFKTKEIPFEEAKALVKNLLNNIRVPKSKPAFNSRNEGIVEKYLNEEYASRRLVDRREPRNRLRRAITAIGNLPLDGTPQHILQRQIDKNYKGNKQRKICSSLNQILKYLKSDVKLTLDYEDLSNPASVTVQEFQSLLMYIKDPLIKLFHEVAFGTGLRAGEIFAILPGDIDGDLLTVKHQIDCNRVRRPTKNRKIRKAYILKAFRPQVKEWANLPLEVKLAFRKRSISKITRKASQAALKRSIRFHDLRHSYVRYLLNIGDSLTRIKDYIGDSLKTAEKSYAGFQASSEQASHTARLE